MNAWVAACRPRTLPAAIAPVMVGTACAAIEGGARPGIAVAALAGAVLIQIGTNLVNDAGDFLRGADAVRTGEARACASGALTPRAVRTAAVAAFAAAAIPGLILIAAAGWPVIAVGVASIAAGVAYTAGRVPLGYRGLGDLFVFVFFGIVAVTATAYVQLGRVPPVTWLAAVPVGALATAILVVNNLRDVVGDARAGKRTLAVRLGPRAARAEYVLLLAIAAAIPVALWVAGCAPVAVLLPLATLPLAAAPVRAVVTGATGQALDRALARTARLLLAFSLALAIGLAT